MKVALVHDWLTGMRGGEKVLEVFCELFPEADLFTLIHVKGSCSSVIEKMSIRTSFLQRIPGAAQRYRYFLPLFPHAIESFALKGYDLVLSSSHCVAKGVVPPTGALHVSYVHTPMRYVWDQYEDYFGPGRAPLATRLAARAAAPFLRAWDETSSSRVDVFVANSKNVARRVERRYRRHAAVIYPPVDCARFTAPPDSRAGTAYLMVTAFAPYKRVDLAIEAFERLKRPLLVVGAGQDARRLRRRASPNVIFLEPKTPDELVPMYSRARALVFPGEEDFGITPLEAQACGRPVIAYGKGGVTESVLPLGNPQAAATGIFFAEQTAPALVDAVLRFEECEAEFDPRAARAQALRFDRPLFKQKMRSFLEQLLSERRSDAGRDDMSVPRAQA